MAKMEMSDLQHYTWMLCLIKYELDINGFVSLNSLLSFTVSLRKWLAHFLLIKSKGETLFESEKRR